MADLVKLLIWFEEYQMSDENIISLVERKAEEFTSSSIEHHFHLKKFFSRAEARDFVDDVISLYDQNEYFCREEIRPLNGGFQGVVQVKKRQGELFDGD